MAIAILADPDFTPATLPNGQPYLQTFEGRLET